MEEGRGQGRRRAPYTLRSEHNAVSSYVWIISTGNAVITVLQNHIHGAVPSQVVAFTQNEVEVNLCAFVYRTIR